jgi:hypothetical protein
MRLRKWVVLAAIAAAVVLLYAFWPHIINLMLPADSRPRRVTFTSERVTAQQFDATAAELTELTGPGSSMPAGQSWTDFPHVERFKKAGILSYEGPKTCLKCHRRISVKDPATRGVRKVDLMDNLLRSAHYRFFTKRHPNVYGFNGVLADNFPMGKIDRPCPKPGSFAMTSWVTLIELKDGRTYSEGCGQCHAGGQYQAPLGEIMPGYRTLGVEKEAIDCLICHAIAYDMNRKQAVTDRNGRLHWGQDRSMRAAMSVVRPTAQNCLRCHQHNMGGDVYVDERDPSFMQSLANLGKDRPRVRHPGSKRGTPYSPSWDVHAAAGIACIDCHATEGHLIARGTHTTTIMANDLPGVEVTCEQCHPPRPHIGQEGTEGTAAVRARAGGPGRAASARYQYTHEFAEYLNNHTEVVACVTCHISSLHPDNVTMRDFSTPVFEEGAGIYIYNDISKETEPGKGIVYVWWDGDASFLGNAIGDNPNGAGLYRFYKPAHVWPEYKDFDYAAWYEKVMRPISRRKPSKLYAIKLYNGKQHIDLQNMSPFGGMFLPYEFPTYYTTGDAGAAAQKEARKSMMKMMYGRMFDVYLMDKFMTFMDAPGWNTGAYKDVLALRKVDPRWIPQDASMEISHAIRREGALVCADCHGPAGVLSWKDLGYTNEQVQVLSVDPLGK